MEKIEKGQRWQWWCDESRDQYDVVDVITDGLSYTLAIVNKDYSPFTYSQADFDAEEDHWSLIRCITGFGTRNSRTTTKRND